MVVAGEDRLRGASVYEKQVFSSLRAHERHEEEVIDDYETFAQASTSMTVRYLMDMIVEDERRHHRIMEELANTVRAQATLEEKGARLPFIDVEGDPATLAETRRFLRSERRERSELRRLARRLRVVGDDLDAFVVEVMRLDTERHIRILKFIERLVRHSPRRAAAARPT